MSPPGALVRLVENSAVPPWRLITPSLPAFTRLKSSRLPFSTRISPPARFLSPRAISPSPVITPLLSSQPLLPSRAPEPMSSSRPLLVIDASTSTDWALPTNNRPPALTAINVLPSTWWLWR